MVIEIITSTIAVIASIYYVYKKIKKEEFIYLNFCFGKFPNFIHLPFYKDNLLNLEFLEKQIICICKNEFMIDLMMINNIVALSITNLQNNIHYFSMSFF